jgi:hypothetical protein
MCTRAHLHALSICMDASRRQRSRTSLFSPSTARSDDRNGGIVFVGVLILLILAPLVLILVLPSINFFIILLTFITILEVFSPVTHTRSYALAHVILVMWHRLKSRVSNRASPTRRPRTRHPRVWAKRMSWAWIYAARSRGRAWGTTWTSARTRGACRPIWELPRADGCAAPRSTTRSAA